MNEVEAMEFTVDFKWFEESDQIDIDTVSSIVVQPAFVRIYGTYDGEKVEYEKTAMELKELKITS